MRAYFFILILTPSILLTACGGDDDHQTSKPQPSDPSCEIHCAP
ncbi:hypothetical protein SAMN05216500_11189 [Acinetobacter sp. DSM 11652]|nr:hypothetical protein SAMN05216500_11189 [Acinetobacter sp. DSM 11652]